MMDEKKMDERFMREAIRQARKAGALMEVPIGCVIVYEGKDYCKRIQPEKYG